jgi:hypothetical protein
MQFPPVLISAYYYSRICHTNRDFVSSPPSQGASSNLRFYAPGWSYNSSGKTTGELQKEII